MKRIISIVLAIVMTAAVIGTLVLAQNNEIIKGDINGDGKTDNKDVVVLFRYVSGGKKAEDESAYDFNEDGNVDNKDVIALFRELSGGAESAANKIYLYAVGQGGTGGGTAKPYVGKKFLSSDNRKTKNNMDDRTVNIFGTNHIAEYLESFSFDAYDEGYDMYLSDDGLFTFCEESGKLATYENLSGERAEGFEPPVNEQSDEDDIIEYAKEVLHEYAGTETDDCDVVVNTYENKYSIVFRKKFNGIYRIDDISVTISKSGDVLKIVSRTCDAKMEPFEDIELDVKSLRNQIKSIFPDPGNGYYEIIMRAIPYGAELWVLAEVKYSSGEGTDTFIDGVMYITKVAEINSGEPVTEPEHTDPDTEDTNICAEIDKFKAASLKDF